jgi:alpha-glucosidase (family GH31 glycosyl hydrolase)
MKYRILYVLYFLMVIPVYDCLAQGFSIKANSVFFSGLRIQVLTPTMIRIQKKYNKKFPDSLDLGVVNLTFPQTLFSVRQIGGNYTIKTDSLLITYQPELDITQGGVKIVSNNGFVLESLSSKDSENLGGVIGSLDNCKGNMRYSEQNDVSSVAEIHPIPDGILSKRGFTVLKHVPDTLYFYKQGDSFNELYVMAYGRNYKEALKDFYQLAGHIPLLPKWSLGFIYSRWKDYNATDYKSIVTRFRQEGMPIDGIILDMCWHVDYWYGFRYNTTSFPDMIAFHKWTDSVHLKTGFNHHAGALYYKDPQIHEFCERAGINYNMALTKGLSWEPEQKIIRYDPSNKRQFGTFYEMYLSRLMKDGLDFHWVDGESSIYSSYLYQKFTEEFTKKRAVVMNRLQTEVLSNHRFPFGFSGDTYVSWETMSYSSEVNIKGGNCGVYWSHDIGGYMPQGSSGYPASPEIFARWLQLGAMSPIFRVHAKKDVYWIPPYKAGGFDHGSRLPWEWGDTVLNSARISIQLRYKLLPYIYTMMRNAHDDGLPLCRGLYIEYPDNVKAYRYDEYLFGDNMLVAPIVEPSNNAKYVSNKSLWLPKGDWYDYFTNHVYSGDKNIVVSKNIDQFPLFVKAGSIIPAAPYEEYSGAPLDTLLLFVYTPLQNSHSNFRLYEDDGESFQYTNNAFRWIKLQYEYKKDSIQRIVVQKPIGSFKNNIETRAYQIQIVNTNKCKMVRVNGKYLSAIKEGVNNGWSWDAERKIITVTIAKRSVLSDLVIEAVL